MEEQSAIAVFMREKLAAPPEIQVFHAVAFKLQQVLATPDYSIEAVTQLIMTDPRLASQVLRMANSVFYGGLSKVATIRDAIVRMGAREVANIAMVATQQELYRSSDPRINKTMKTLWEHAVCTAIGSRWLAGKTGFAPLAQEAFLAGLLHDIGKLYLLKVLEEGTRTTAVGKVLTHEMVAEVLNSLHVEQGVALMRKWNLPEIYCDVIREHHLDHWKQDRPLLALVRLVNLSCNRLGIGIDPPATQETFDTPEARLLGVSETILADLETTIKEAAQIALAIARGGASSL